MNEHEQTAEIFWQEEVKPTLAKLEGWEAKLNYLSWLYCECAINLLRSKQDVR